MSLSPIASKSLLLLNAEDDIVGCTKWCPCADSKPIVASAIDVNIEEVLRLAPDIVFASTLTSKESIMTLKQVGINVVQLPKMIDFGSMCDDLLLLGKEIGKLEMAKLEVKIAKANLAEVRKRIPDEKKSQVVFQLGAKPLFVAIPNTFMDDYIRQAGATNLYSDLNHGTVTRESVLMRNPDAIFISTMPTAAEDAQLAWSKYPQLKASVNNKVVLIDQELASSPTIHSFVKVVGIMIDVLYN